MVVRADPARRCLLGQTGHIGCFEHPRLDYVCGLHRLPYRLAVVLEAKQRQRQQLLVLSMQVDNFEETWARIEADPVNARWQAAMAPYFAPLDPLLPGERFPMMREVFYMP